MLLTDGAKESVYLSGRNLDRVTVRPFGQESVYDILWANVVLIEQQALEASEPSEADRKAGVALSRGPSQAKVREEAQKKNRGVSRRERRGHKSVSQVKVVEEKGLEEAAYPKEEESKFDISSIKLPKISELAEFLLQFDSFSDIEELKGRDGRKTAQALYEARLAGLGSDSDEEDGDA